MRKQNRRESYQVESLENRLLLSTIPVTLHINELFQLLDPDLVGDGDYFAKVKMGNDPEISTEDALDNPVSGFDIFPGWTFTTMADPSAGPVPITINIFDSDPIGNDTVDINPASGPTSITLLFDPVNQTWTSENNEIPANQGFTAGAEDGDGSAEIFFSIFDSVPVTLNVTEFDQIDNPDGDNPFGGDGDYVFNAKIGDNAETTTGPSITFEGSQLLFGPGGLAFTGYVDPRQFTSDPVPVTVKVFDEDLIGSDTIDINGRSGNTSLTLDYDLNTQRWREESGAFSFPDNSSQGDGEGGDNARGKIFFNITQGADSDGDGLPDIWETAGIDANHDGKVDLQLNTDPRHKDLFVEADAMKGLAPSTAALDDVVNAFAAAPNSEVHNPDGHDGITLHVLLDETNIPVKDWTPDPLWQDFDAIKQNKNPNIPGGFGTVADRASPNAAGILAAKAEVFRYCIFAYNYATNLSSGLAELGFTPPFGGNDFFVTLGSVGGGTRQQQAGAFMHELGHTLGLHHGGNTEDTNFKPNYHSVMNYIWSFPEIVGPTSSSDEKTFANSWRLDYSRRAFNDLDEKNGVSESTGFGGDAGNVVKLVDGTFFPESGPVDLNFDGDFLDTVKGDLNGDGSRDTLLASEDWSHLLYNFKFTTNFSDGQSVHHDLIGPEFPISVFEDQNQALLYATKLGNGADSVTLRRNGPNLEVVDDATNAVVASRALADTRLIQIIGENDEDDALTIDFASGGYFTVPEGISFAGGTGGHDSLQIIGANGTTGTYTPSATTAGDGTAAINLGAQSVTIGFTGLEPVEVSGMASFTMVTPNSADVLSLSDGLDAASQAVHTVSGTSGGVPFESLSFFNIDTFILDAAANDGASPEDAITVAMSGPAAGVSAVNVNTGAGADTMNVSASPGVPINLHAGAGGDQLNFAGDSQTFTMTGTSFSSATRQTVTYDGIDGIRLSTGTFNTSGSIAPPMVVDAAATLGGTGTVAGGMTVDNGGTVSPGVGGAGILGSGNASFAAGSTYSVDISGATAGTSFDQLNVTGTVNLGGATLTGTVNSSVLPGDEFVIVRNDGADPVVGQFAGGSLVTIDGKKFAVDYAFDADGDGKFNDVALLAFGAALGPDPCDPSRTALYVSGTTGDDVIRFVSVTGNKRVRVLINGEDEGTFEPSGLLLGFGQAGNDQISVEMPSKAAWLYGQGGDDSLTTGNGDSVLIGGLGNDHLTSGNGKDFLIGGAGADVLDSGNGEDLLIAGSTAFDTNSADHRHSLCLIDDAWTQGGRLSTLLNGTNLFNDTDIDQLMGGNGTDRFFASAQDVITGLASKEIVTPLV